MTVTKQSAFRMGEVFIQSIKAGEISETENGYRFQYDVKYLNRPKAQPISVTLPLQSQPYHSKVLFPFFDGLIPEGWLLAFSEQIWKLNARDRMGLLLTSCSDCIGNIKVLPTEKFSGK